MRTNDIPRAVRSGSGVTATLGGRRGLMAVMANATDPRPGEIRAAIDQIATNFDKFKAHHEGVLNDVQASVDDIAVRLAVSALGGPGGDPALDPQYSNDFEAYARRGEGFQALVTANREGDRGRINAAMSISPGEAGGVLAPVEWDRKISKAQREISPFRQIATVLTTTVSGYSTIWSDGGFGSGWVGETANRPATSTAGLKTLMFGHGEIYAFPFVTQRLIDDADFKLEDWLAAEVADEFDKQEGIAFLAGDGVNKPQGLLTFATGGSAANVHPGGAIPVVPTGAATALGGPDTLVDFVYGLPSVYRKNARWLMNSKTAATIAKMKDGQGNYLWRETYVAGQPATLLGYPVAIDDNMPDVGAGAIPIAFGDFARAYVINDRFGVRVLRDPYSVKPYVGFYTTKRVGGGLLDPRAMRFMKVAAS